MKFITFSKRNRLRFASSSFHSFTYHACGGRSGRSTSSMGFEDEAENTEGVISAVIITVYMEGLVFVSWG